MFLNVFMYNIKTCIIFLLKCPNLLAFRIIFQTLISLKQFSRISRKKLTNLRIKKKHTSKIVMTFQIHKFATGLK